MSSQTNVQYFFRKPLTLKMGEKETNVLDLRKILKTLRLANAAISKQEETIKEVFIR
ncbi:hypothetical protein E4U50_000140, partial [Claviceps purpurea]